MPPVPLADPPIALTMESTTVVVETVEEVINVEVAQVGAQGPRGQAGSTSVPFSAGGVLSAGPGTSELPIDGSYTLDTITAHVKTAPTGSDIVLDLNLNGVSVFTDQSKRPKILDGQKSAAVVSNMDITALSAGDVLSVDIDSVGSTYPGASLVVVVRYH